MFRRHILNILIPVVNIITPRQGYDSRIVHICTGKHPLQWEMPSSVPLTDWVFLPRIHANLWCLVQTSPLFPDDPSIIHKIVLVKSKPQLLAVFDSLAVVAQTKAFRA